MKSWFGKLIVPFLALAILFFITDAYITLLNIATLRTNTTLISHSHNVTNLLEKTMNVLVDAETGERGYLASKNSLYLQPYTIALPLISDYQTELQLLTRDNPIQQKNTVQLRSETNMRVDLLKKTILLIQSGATDSEAINTNEVQGKKVMDDIRTIIDNMQTQENTRLAQQEQMTAQSYLAIYIITALTTFFNIFLVILVFALVRKELEKRDQLKKALEAKEENFRSIADIMPQQVWTASPKGLLDYVNIQTIQYFGKTESEIIGAGWQDFIHPDDLPNCIKIWTESLHTGKIYEIEFRLRNKRGIYKWHLARAKPIFLHKHILRWVGTNTDINEKKLLQKQQNDFVSIATHELKTPVPSAKAFAQVLQRKFQKSGDKFSATQLGKIDMQMNNLTALISDMLDATKIDSGQLRMNFELFTFDVFVKEIVEDVQRTSIKHKIRIEGKTNKKIIADRERTGQVLINLLTNAMKYSPDSNNIIVHLKGTSTTVEVGVQDFGIGIPKDKQLKVFERFYRVIGAKDNTFSGLGLGLFISSEIIKRQNGKIWVESKYKNGSTFCFTLPIQQTKKNI